LEGNIDFNCGIQQFKKNLGTLSSVQGERDQRERANEAVNPWRHMMRDAVKGPLKAAARGKTKRNAT
jgi:hypothetical protein